MKLRLLFPRLTVQDLLFWSLSTAAIVLSYFLYPTGDFVSVIGSVVGVTALIYIAKGVVMGQFFSLAFCLFYGIYSLFFAYYGESVTYLGMSAPAAVFSIISWIRNPYRDSGRVKVSRLGLGRMMLTVLACVPVTVLFWFVLRALGTAQPVVSTFSIATSFLAAALSFQRSSFFALAYAVNDVVLILLWGREYLSDPSVLPVIVCFASFLFNDIRTFVSWQRLHREQED